MTALLVRPAAPGEEGLVLSFIRELAAYEELLDEACVSAEDVRLALFGVPPRASCEIVEADGRPVGMALWFYNFSTFKGRPGLYLEDLYVRPEARGRGAGKALLEALARRCLAEGLPRMDWVVLNWNAPSIAFYDRLGAERLDGWTTRRLSGRALRRLAGAPDEAPLDP
jgi:GNAT superfamily N-acetyltransferase